MGDGSPIGTIHSKANPKQKEKKDKEKEIPLESHHKANNSAIFGNTKIVVQVVKAPRGKPSNNSIGKTIIFI